MDGCALGCGESVSFALPLFVDNMRGEWVKGEATGE